MSHVTNPTHPQMAELLALRYFAPRLALKNNLRVNSNLSGNHRSFARGRGMDFDEVRRYQAGDDIRLIHWPLTARTGKAYTKIYHEERERTVYLVIDQSLSMAFATRVAFKSVIAARIAALLGWSALQQHQQVGGIVFTQAASHYIKPVRSESSLLELFKVLSSIDSSSSVNGSVAAKVSSLEPSNLAPSNLAPSNLAPSGIAGGLSAALSFLAGQLATGSSVIVVSDFMQAEVGLEDQLRRIRHKASLNLLFIYDPIEAELPETGIWSFAGVNQQRVVIESSAKNRLRYAQLFREREQKLQQIAERNRLGYSKLATTADLVASLRGGVSGYGK